MFAFDDHLVHSIFCLTSIFYKEMEQSKISCTLHCGAGVSNFVSVFVYLPSLPFSFSPPLSHSLSLSLSLSLQGGATVVVPGGSIVCVPR